MDDPRPPVPGAPSWQRTQFFIPLAGLTRPPGIQKFVPFAPTGMKTPTATTGGGTAQQGCAAPTPMGQATVEAKLLDQSQPKRVKVDMARLAEYKNTLAASKAVFRNFAKELGMSMADEIRDIIFHSCRTTMVDMALQQDVEKLLTRNGPAICQRKWSYGGSGLLRNQGQCHACS